MTNVNYAVDDRIATVTIDRPHRRNAVDSNTARELAAAFRRFDDDGAADVAVLQGAGGNFCAGADLKALAAGDRRSMRIDDDAPMGPTRLQLTKPVIAAIEGYAVAGGMELALWCDLRVVAETATMGIFCRRFGVPLVDLGTIRLPRLIGHSRAMDLILTGRAVDAEEAASIGLANRVAEQGRAYDVALALAREIAAFPQQCLRNDRLSAIAQWDMSSDDAAAFELARGRDTIDSGEVLAGARRFDAGAGRQGRFDADE